MSNIHKGTELNNINETWKQNEKDRKNSNADGEAGGAEEVPAQNELDQEIREEAAAYDRENKADRVLPGERASVHDDQGDAGGDE